jgi:hypothetical protein
MPFAGIKDARVRADLLAFLKEATKPGAMQQMAQLGGMKDMGGMMGGKGMMSGGGKDPNLKSLEPNRQVKTITYRHDTYRVTTADDRSPSVQYSDDGVGYGTDRMHKGKGQNCCLPVLGARSVAFLTSTARTCNASGLATRSGSRIWVALMSGLPRIRRHETSRV